VEESEGESRGFTWPETHGLSQAVASDKSDSVDAFIAALPASAQVDDAEPWMVGSLRRGDILNVPRETAAFTKFKSFLFDDVRFQQQRNASNLFVHPRIITDKFNLIRTGDKSFEAMRSDFVRNSHTPRATPRTPSCQPCIVNPASPLLSPHPLQSV